MDIADFITPDRVMIELRVRDKTQLLRDVAARLERSAGGLSVETILAELRSREELGSTGLGRGFALPHARLEALPGFVGMFARLARPIDYDAIDGEPVDLVFALLMPADASQSHVAALAAISRRFRDAEVVARLRRGDAEAVFAALTGH
jgi:nitrogen PTS system EIIA component